MTFTKCQYDSWRLFMKKLIIALLFTSLVSAAFSEEPNKGYIGGHFSVPLIFESVEDSGVKNNSTMTSIGFGMDIVSLKNDQVGLYFNMEVILPMSIKQKVKTGTNTYSFEVSRSDYETLLGFNGFLGVAFRLYNENNLLLSISPGVNYIMLFADTTSASTMSILFGIGANVQGSINLNENFCLTLGADVAYDFLGLSRINDGDFNSSKGHDFIISPKIGIGYKPKSLK